MKITCDLPPMVVVTTTPDVPEADVFAWFELLDRKARLHRGEAALMSGSKQDVPPSLQGREPTSADCPPGTDCWGCGRIDKPIVGWAWQHLDEGKATMYPLCSKCKSALIRGGKDWFEAKCSSPDYMIDKGDLIRATRQAPSKGGGI